jgi:K(+)-stimulated pyrophosphate-energized sodium pump
MNPTASIREPDSAFRAVFWPVAILLALAVILLWIAGYGPGGQSCRPAPAATSAVAAPAAEAASAAPMAGAPVPAAPAADKLYFALNSADLDADNKAKLSRFADFLKANPSASAVLSGYHDPSGDLARNQELALNRARAVRAALGEAGIAENRVEMAKPAQTAAGGPPEEARRVEISIKP